jgi:hypothetical protein
MAADSGGDRWSGFLLKAGAQNKSWKRRFFVLAAGSLRYYKRELDPRSATLAEQDAGQVLLAGASGVVSFDSGGGECLSFSIITKDRVWLLQYTSKAQREVCRGLQRVSALPAMPHA